MIPPFLDVGFTVVQFNGRLDSVDEPFDSDDDDDEEDEEDEETTDTPGCRMVFCNWSSVGKRCCFLTGRDAEYGVVMAGSPMSSTIEYLKKKIVFC